MANGDEDEGVEGEGNEGNDAESYFASIAGVEAKGGVVVAQVDNRGSQALPAGWVSVTGRIWPTGTSDQYDLERRTNDQPIEPDATWDAPEWSLNGWGDGRYTLTVSMVVADQQGEQYALDQYAEKEISVQQGNATEYHADQIADAELGDEHAEDSEADFNVSFDPVPYLENGRLLVTVRNDGPSTLPVGTTMGAAGELDINEKLTLDRQVAAGDSWSGSFGLPDRDPGNYSVLIEGTIDPSLHGEGKSIANDDFVFSFWGEVCYQSQGPVEVLLK